MKLRAPPRLEVLRALSALAADRVKLVGPREVVVKSSDLTREFRVERDPADNAVSCSDPVTVMEGKMGYPVVAYLMLQGDLPYDPGLASGLAGVDWESLLRRFGGRRGVAGEVTSRWHWSERRKLDRFVAWVTDMASDLEVERKEPRTKLTDFV
jgi:hypothetical protein